MLKKHCFLNPLKIYPKLWSLRKNHPVTHGQEFLVGLLVRNFKRRFLYSGSCRQQLQTQLLLQATGVWSPPRWELKDSAAVSWPPPLERPCTQQKHKLGLASQDLDSEKGGTIQVCMVHITCSSRNLICHPVYFIKSDSHSHFWTQNKVSLWYWTGQQVSNLHRWS